MKHGKNPLDLFHLIMVVYLKYWIKVLQNTVAWILADFKKLRRSEEKIRKQEGRDGRQKLEKRNPEP